MQKLRLFTRFLAFFLISGTPHVASAQYGGRGGPSADFALIGRHAIQVNVGLHYWTPAETTVSGSGVSASTQTSGFVGSISHRFWLTERWAIGPTIALLDTAPLTNVGTSGVSSESNLVTSILFGVMYYFPPAGISGTMRPYVGAGFGPYMGSATRTLVGGTIEAETISVTAFGARPVAGVDWFLNRWLQFNISAGYHLVSNFEEPVGNEDNFSGAEFSMGLGFLVGRGYQ